MQISLISRQKIPVKIPAATAECWRRRYPLCLMSLGAFRCVERRVCAQRGDRSNQAVLASGSRSQIPPLTHP